MKPIHLNLTARPYRDYRPVYAVVVAISLVTAFLMLNNIDTYVKYISETRHTRSSIAELQRATDQERQRADMVERRLRTLDLKLLDDQTRFVNQKLRERAFSWSVLLDELETILPNHTRLLSITPLFAADGSISLVLSFESKSPEGLTTVLNRLLADPQFAHPFPDTENVTNGLYSFGIRTQFFPPGVQNPNAARIVKAVAK